MATSHLKIYVFDSLTLVGFSHTTKGSLALFIARVDVNEKFRVGIMMILIKISISRADVNYVNAYFDAIYTVVSISYVHCLCLRDLSLH